jgi:uncharacterized protein (DUF2147 family)
MKQLMLLLLMATFAIGVNAQTIVGVWKTIDDKTGKARSHVKIYKGKDGKYYGKIIKLLNRTKEEGDDPYCTKCSKKDYRHNKRVIGMNIMTRMKGGKGLKSASGGKILDPKNGKVYGCNMKLSENGKKLKVRGYLGFSALGRTQTWIRLK